MQYQSEITGVSPLIQNKPLEYGFDQQWVEKKATNAEDRDCLKCLYTDKDGNICQPAIHLEKAMCDGAKKIKMKGNGKATYSKIFGSMVFVTPLLVIHQLQEYEVFKNMVVVPATKGRIMRYRPMLTNWRLKFVINSEPEIPADVLEQSLTFAGKYCGLGDFRPQKGGKYGKFNVTSFSQI